MSSDLRELLHEAAPRPALSLDEKEIARRARRMSVTRVAAAVVVALGVLGGGLVAASVRAPERQGVIGDVRPQPAPSPPEPRALDHKRRIPGGPRFELAAGVFGDDWDYHAGRAWRLLVWGHPRESCWQVALEGEARYSNVGCTHGRDPEDAAGDVFAGSSYLQTGSSDPAAFAFVSGEMGPRVARLEFRGDRGGDFSIPLYAAPRHTGIAHRYYASVLPRFDYGHLVALSEDGDELSSRRLCGIGCHAQKEREREIEVLAYEHTPVSTESAAAAFAIEAAARAGLVDQLGTTWSYRTISSDDLVASFRTTECEARRGGRYECDRAQGAATVDVGVEDDRFVVEAVDGPVTGEQRTELESRSAPVTDDVREWRHVAQSFASAGGKRWHIAFVAVWTGNLDAPRDYGSTCRYTLYDASGDVLRRSSSIPFLVRSGEYSRVGGLLTTISAGRAPANLELRCTEPGAALSHRP